MALPDIYRALFGKDHLTDGDVISLSEHGRVGGLSTGQGFQHNVLIDKDTGSYLAIVGGAMAVNATGSATLAEQQTQTTSLQLIDDIVATDDSSITAGSQKLNIPGFRYDDTGTDSVDENDVGYARMSANRNQYIQIRDGAGGSERGAAVNLANQLSVSVDNIPTADIEIDGTELGNNQVTVNTTVGGVTILSEIVGRAGVIIKNQGSVTCYIGTGTVTTSNGLELKAGESVGIQTDSEVKGITASSSTTVGYLSLA